MSNLLNVRELADMLSMPLSAIYRMVSDKKIPFIKVGARTRFDPADIKMWLESKKQKPQPKNNNSIINN